MANLRIVADGAHRCEHLGIWLLRAGYTALGCVWVAVFLWRGQQFDVWLIAPNATPSGIAPPFTSRWQRLFLSAICVLGAAVCAVGVYLWRLARGVGKPVSFLFCSACLCWRRWRFGKFNFGEKHSHSRNAPTIRIDQVSTRAVTQGQLT